MDEKIYLVWLHSIWFTHKKLNYIFKSKQNYKYMFENINYDFLKKIWFRDEQVEKILENYKKINLEFLNKKLKEREVKLVICTEKDYPDSLNYIANKPYFIYIRWDLKDKNYFWLVWSRMISSYSKKVISRFVPDLGKYFSVVSGWAMWCDSEAHKVSLQNSIKTVAIIWTGIDIDYPKTNEKLYNEIIEAWWAILSIFPIWEKANAYNFPIRNEIIAWISAWVLVVEAKAKSGSLITAKLALDYGKELFAIPWDIYKSMSEWCNNLIKSWEAKLVAKSKDILEEFNLNINTSLKSEIVFEDDLEKSIYDLLVLEAMNSDLISEKLKIDINTVSSKLSFMEIDKKIRKTLDWTYEII